jgi:hypothetical protein
VAPDAPAPPSAARRFADEEVAPTPEAARPRASSPSRDSDDDASEYEWGALDDDCCAPVPATPGEAGWPAPPTATLVAVPTPERGATDPGTPGFAPEPSPLPVARASKLPRPTRFAPLADANAADPSPARAAALAAARVGRARAVFE